MLCEECSMLQQQCFLLIFIVIMLLVILACFLLLKRRWVRLQLSGGKCNLPTIMWIPRFINYSLEVDEHSNKAERKMRSSSITNILPRMERLKGPYGMYATVYGLTKVVHVAHPFPARFILLGKTSAGNGKNASKKIGRGTPSHSALGALKSPAYDHFKNFSGDGVFTADGQTWKMKRASLLHCLLKGCSRDESIESRKLEFEANNAADAFLSRALKYSCEQKGETTHISQQEEKGVDIVRLLQRSTIGLIYRLLTHHNVDFLQNSESSSILKDYVDDISTESETDDSDSQESLQYNTNMNRDTLKKPTCDASSARILNLLSSYQEAVTNIRMIILAQSRSIWYLLPRWMYRTFSAMFREEERMMVTIREFASIACQNSKPGSPLFMLRFRKSHNPSEADNVKNGNVVNKQLLDEAITLLFAGQDTNAATLSWTLHLLSLNPHIQNRLLEEINNAVRPVSIYDNQSQGELITKKMISNMPYLDAVVKESMRLYPVAPFVVRKIQEKLSIPIEALCDSLSAATNSKSTVEIPQGTFACIWIYGLHRNKELWHRPNDFLPDRWIDRIDPAFNEKKFKGSFMPFATGPRNCLGQPLAQIITRIMLAKIVRGCKVLDKDAVLLQKLPCRSEEHNDFFQQTQNLRKDMQAGFTVFPRNLRIEVYRRL